MSLTIAPGHVGQIYYMVGDTPRIIARNIDLGDEQALHTAVANARANYPSQALKLTVFRLKGSVRKLVNTLPLNAPEPDDSSLSAVPDHLSPAVPSAQPSGSSHGDYFVQWMLAEKDRRIGEKDEVIRDLRDANKIQADSIRQLTEKNNELLLDQKTLGRTHELNLREARMEAEASQQKGLGGVMQQMGSLPPDLLTMVVGRLLGTPTPAPQLGGPALPAGLSTGQQEAIQAVIGLMSQSDEVAIKIYSAVMVFAQRPGGLDHLVQFATQFQSSHAG